jgi:hypothetical protein
MEDKKKVASFFSTKKKNPEKYIEVNPTLDNQIQEAKAKTAVISFGRFSPPTNGHEKLVNSVVSIAKKMEATPEIYLSHSFDAKKNPLSYDEKHKFMTIAFGNIVKKSNARTIIEVLKEISGKYDKLVVVAGSDRIAEFERLLNAYNGKEYNFENIDVVSAGERDPDADDVTGMSASKMRQFVVDGDRDSFKRGLPKKLQSKSDEVYNAVSKGMKLMKEEVEGEELDEATPLTISQRRKRGMVMRRYANKIRIARDRARKRKASPEKLKVRARKKALDFIRQRLMRQKKYSEMTPPEKVALDKRLAKISSTAIDRIARKLLPKVRQAETERLKSLNQPKEESIDINNMFEQFVNEPQTERKKKFRYLFTREGRVNFDGRYKMYRPRNVVNESVDDFEEELFDLIESVEKFVEGAAADRVRANIQMERDADKRKHKRMLARAREIDKVRFEEVDKTDPKNREYGTDSLVKILKKDTPGEEVNEDYYAGLSKSTSDKRRAHFEKGAKMDDDNPAAYKPAPGDARAKTKPSVHTKRFKAMYGEGVDLEESADKSLKDKAEKTGISYGILKKAENNEYVLTENKNDAALRKKAEETGISLSILKQVFRRGVAAWKSGHRPGTTPAQWGHARVNSFSTGGKTRTTADADLWKQHSKNEEFELYIEGLNESAMTDKILDAVRKHVLKGENLMDIVWSISQLSGVDLSAKKIYDMYVSKYGEVGPNKVDKAHAKSLRSKYGFAAEAKADESSEEDGE